MSKDRAINRYVFLRKMIGAFLLLGAWTVQAADSPLVLVRQTTERAVAVLNNPSLQGEKHLQTRRENFWKIVLPTFDSQEIAKRCLGSHWTELTTSQQQEFSSLFIELLKRAYQGALDQHTKEAQFFFDEERVEGDIAEVDTRILSPSLEKAISVNYRLRRAGDNWLIYDVVAENVSLVRNYRNQFNRLLKNASYEGLVQALRKKIQDSNV
jgi:phospholipid transport system substrate-binding protein